MTTIRNFFLLLQYIMLPFGLCFPESLKIGLFVITTATFNLSIKFSLVSIQNCIYQIHQATPQKEIQRSKAGLRTFFLLVFSLNLHSSNSFSIWVIERLLFAVPRQSSIFSHFVTHSFFFNLNLFNATIDIIENFPFEKVFLQN